MPRVTRWFISCLSLVVAVPALAQQQRQSATSASSAAHAPAQPADFGKWETLGNGVLSPDGMWVAYDVRRVNGNNELRYRAVAMDSTRMVPSGETPAFSANSRWLVYGIGYSETERERMDRARRPIHNKVGIVDLRSGKTTVVDEVQAFTLSSDGTHLAMRRYAVEGRRSRGVDLVVRDLEQGTEMTLGNVADFAWSESGALLAMTIDVDGRQGNGVQLLDAGTSTLRSLDASMAIYSGLVWRRRANDLAVLRSRTDSAYADTSYSVIAWRGVGGANVAKRTYDFASDNTFPHEMRVASYRRPLWSEDGRTLFFGIAAREAKLAPDSSRRRGDVLEPAAVEVWHAKDEREIPQQKLQVRQDRERTQLAAWNLDANRFTRLADDSLETVQLSDGQQVAYASDEKPYQYDVMFGRPYRDVFRIDITTGKRERVITKAASAPRASSSGRYLLYTQGGNWWAYDLTNGTRANLTAHIKSAFMDMEDDHPVAERAPYGVAGWTTGDASVILYDRFDLWQVNPDGSAPQRLTRGREDSTVYRYVRLDPEERAIDATKPLYLSATGEWSKKCGYARLAIGQPAQKLVWMDRGVTRLAKAKDADVFEYVVQSYEESPNLFVTTASFANAKPVSRTNSFQSDYAWGKQELVTYTNKHGEKLQAMLTYPANYTPGVKYPMIVYIYEKLTQGMYSYVVPSERSEYNISAFSEAGYFVLRPDIVFRPRDPGYSALDCVVSAVNATVGTGMVDAKRVGVMGHSWGGYETAFFATHGRATFAAAIAGAPLTDLISMYGYTSANTGAPETGHFEVGQERMQVPLWEDPQAYVRNSTVFALDSLQVPLLVEEGDHDGNVNFWQAIELYNFARRLRKNFVMLMYNDENHNLAKKNNQIDYHRRQLEWFDHYLKGAPAASWITNGESYIARQDVLKAAGVSAEGAGASGGAGPAAPAGGGRGRGRGGN